MATKKLLSILLVTLFGTLNIEKINAQETNIVNPNQVYTYQIMTRDLFNLSKKYPDIIDVKEIGKSEYGRSILAVKLGKGEANVFLNGAHHAREWLTTTLLVKMIEEYANAYTNNQCIGEYSVREELDKTSIWFVPMVNPDGVTLQQGFLNSFPKSVQDKLVKINGGSKNFKSWKADARGIDLNRQYPANWEQITGGAKSPARSDYKGTKPLITKENNVLVKFTNAINPEITVSYHSSGRIIYWYFYNKAENIERDKKIADTLSSITGYSLVKPSTYIEGGGYKDWFIQKYNRPGYTIEIGKDAGNTNLPLSAFDEEWKRNKKVGIYIASEGYKLWDARFQAELKNIMKNIEEEEARLSRLEKRNKENFIKLAELYKKAKYNELILFVNGQRGVFKNVKPFRQESTVMIPLKEFAKFTNIEIEVNDDTKEIVLKKNDKLIKFTPNQSTVVVNDVPISINTPINVVNGEILVPDSFILETLDIELNFDETGQIIFVEN